jgi:Ca-activated chloride channel family protein
VTFLLHPWMLLLALLVPAVVLLRRRRRPPAVLFAPAALLPASLPASWRTRLLPLPGLLVALGLLLAATALARPVRRVPLPLRSEGADILLCLDLSSSMTARDLGGGRTRLEVARDAAIRFVRGRPGDRIGLLGFARYPDVRCPPTLDHAALEAILREVAPVAGDGPEDATGIGAAAARAAGALRGGKARSRVAILLTDGEENVATSGTPGAIEPSHAAELCRELGVRVHAVTAGPAENRTLAGMAAATGGRSFAARDAGALEAVYAAIDALEKTPFEKDRFALEERFRPFLVAALALLLLGRLLGSLVLPVIP